MTSFWNAPEKTTHCSLLKPKLLQFPCQFASVHTKRTLSERACGALSAHTLRTLVRERGTYVELGGGDG